MTLATIAQQGQGVQDPLRGCEEMPEHPNAETQRFRRENLYNMGFPLFCASEVDSGYFRRLSNFRIVQANQIATARFGLILEKAVDHGEHSEHIGKTMACNVFMNHPLGEQ
ncbi:hypothetical protein [Propionivibrio sp.]|uniref:hypothetical protein n=1 Tax=Propionivibrio sp. TaxID=2212460 RepID=UPI003BF063EA